MRSESGEEREGRTRRRTNKGLYLIRREIVRIEGKENVR